MKHFYISSILFFITFLTFGQERYLSIKSKDSVNGQPRFMSSFGANIKLNGYYDVFGGLQDSETFNVGLINVYDDDDASAFHMDMYQTQLKFETNYIDVSGHELKAYVEFDFWGGNGHMRLRKAYVETDHWQIGQNWNAFGDEVLWPNIMEWEGPPSGIWVRSPHVKYSNNFKNDRWKYEISIEAPINDYNRYGEYDILVDEAHQITPDLVFALKNEHDWGHLRLSSIFRNIRYELDGELSSFFGYGFSFSGIYKPNKNNFQFQFVGGKGITAYMTSIAGLGYDGFPTIDNDFSATPAFGGWISYEYFFTDKLHVNAVLGDTNFKLDKVNRVVSDGSDKIVVLKGDIRNDHYYGLFNIMYDPFKRMTLGLELDYGVKKVKIDGTLNDIHVDDITTRDAMRISFGLMFYF